MFISWLIFISTFSTLAFADNGQSAAPISSPAAMPSKDSKERNFYEVLDDVLADFEYDLKNGNVNGLKDLSIRNVALSENVPPSFKSHLELLLTERVLRNSKTHVLQCLPCKAKKTSLDGDHVIISSPDSNPAELARIAKLAGISHYMDVAFLYQPSGMVAGLTIVDPESQDIIWSHTYNSETSRASAFRRGVDYSQIDDARRSTEYAPMVQHRIALMYLFEPDLPSQAGCLALGYRVVERYNNRRNEVGFEADYMTNASTIVNSTGASAQDIYARFGFNLTLLFLHTWNFIGEEENFNKMRGSFTLGLGGTYASGFLGGLIRSTYEWRMAKHFGVSFILGYRPPGSAFISGTASGTITGVEYGLGVNVLF